MICYLVANIFYMSIIGGMETYYKLKELYNGNRSALARDLSLNSPMVAQRWEKVAKIPEWRIKDVESLYAKKLKDITSKVITAETSASA